MLIGYRNILQRLPPLFLLPLHNFSLLSCFGMAFAMLDSFGDFISYLDLKWNYSLWRSVWNVTILLISHFLVIAGLPALCSIRLWESITEALKGPSDGITNISHQAMNTNVSAYDLFCRITGTWVEIWKKS